MLFENVSTEIGVIFEDSFKNYNHIYQQQ